MSALTLYPPFSPLGVKSELSEFWLEDFLDLKASYPAYEEYEENLSTMRRSLRIRDSNQQQTQQHGKKRRKSLDSEIHQNQSENEEEEEEDTPKIPTSKLTLLLLRKEGWRRDWDWDRARLLIELLFFQWRMRWYEILLLSICIGSLISSEKYAQSLMERILQGVQAVFLSLWKLGLVSSPNFPELISTLSQHLLGHPVFMVSLKLLSKSSLVTEAQFLLSIQLQFFFFKVVYISPITCALWLVNKKKPWKKNRGP